MRFKWIQLLFLTWFSMPILAASEGASNGKPFQELQVAIDAAVAAEAAARAAEDAALTAMIAAEEATRILADLALQAEIDAQAVLLLDLDDRVSVLEGLILERSVTWTETANTFDVVDLAGTIAGLNYQTGEWIAFISSNAVTGREEGNCTNSPLIASWLNAVVSGSAYTSGRVMDNTSRWLHSGIWYNSVPLYLISSVSTNSQTLQIVGGPPFNHAVVDRKGTTSQIDNEVYSFFGGGLGYAIGNTLTLNVASTRLDACGF
jgi:hypothetical protein